MAARFTESFDILHVQVAEGCNAHDVARDMQEAFPFRNELEVVKGVNAAGEVEVLLNNEHPSYEQDNWLEDHPCVTGRYMVNQA